MKLNSIYLDLSNSKQVEWWNSISKFVKVKHYTTMVETATNKTVGYIICPAGILARWIIKKAGSFHRNPTIGTFSFKE